MVFVVAAFIACGGALKAPLPVVAASNCGSLVPEACNRARGLLSAATGFTNVRHEYILDPTSTFAPGRGVEQMSGGLWNALPIACAKPQGGPRLDGQSIDFGQNTKVDAQTIDFGFVGVSIDSTLVSAEADVSPFFNAGAEAGIHHVRLVAIAFVRDLDPQFFEASDEVSLSGQSCACRNATHFVGSVKLGGMLAYETTVREADVHMTALQLVKAKLSAKDATITETRVGGLEVDGLAEQLNGSGATKPLTFRVSNPVPVAFAAYPISDVCKFGFPAPDVTPAMVDFGDTPYGRESQRLVHVVNRANFDVRATVGRRVVDVGARASVDVPISWAPVGDATGCDSQQREETLVFAPKAEGAPVAPQQQTSRIVETIHAGKPTVVRAEHVDTGERRSPDYASTVRDWTCPPDYVVATCRTQGESCGDGALGCSSLGYFLAADTANNGCHFGCKGPTSIIAASNYCRFDAVMECKLACGSGNNQHK